MTSNVVMKPCPHCGTLLLGSLVDSINDPRQSESCWKHAEVKSTIQQIEEIRSNLGAILKPTGWLKWWNTPIPAWDGDTPHMRANLGDLNTVVTLTRTYLDPSYA